MLKRVFRPWFQLLLAIAFLILSAILEGVVFAKTLGLLDYAMEGDIQTLRAVLPTFFVLALCIMPVGILATVTKSWYRKSANLSMKKYYIRNVFHKNISEFQHENTATYISRLTNDCNTLDVNYIEGMFSIFSGIAQFCVMLWVISGVGKGMVGFSLRITMVAAIISFVMSRPISKKVKDRSDKFDGFTSYIKEVLSAFHIIKTNDLSQKVRNDYSEKSCQIQDKGYQIDKSYTLINGFENGMFSLCIYMALGSLVIKAANGELSAGGVLTVSLGLQKLAWPLMMTIEAVPKVMSSQKLAKKINDSLKNKDNYVETQPFHQLESEVALEDVAFRYEDEKEGDNTLYNVSMRLKKNGKYLIIGPSGGGKSTLLKLFRKYYKPTSGTITIDGVNLTDIKKEDFFSQIANIEQQVFIFEDTLRNNITLYKEYTDDELMHAVEAAGLTDMVRKLPDGLDTMIYDNGKNISGGERSRVVIARALLAKASILFMDEAFAALDMERAREIEKTILALDHITVINVSHVIFKDTMSKYDAIYRVKGTVSEMKA